MSEERCMGLAKAGIGTAESGARQFCSARQRGSSEVKPAVDLQLRRMVASIVVCDCHRVACPCDVRSPLVVRVF